MSVLVLEMGIERRSADFGPLQDCLDRDVLELLLEHELHEGGAEPMGAPPGARISGIHFPHIRR